MILLIHVRWHRFLYVSPEEIAHAVEDGLAPVDFNRTQMMNTGCHKGVGTRVDRLMRQVLQEFGRRVSEIVFRFSRRASCWLVRVDGSDEKIRMLLALPHSAQNSRQIGRIHFVAKAEAFSQNK